MLQATNAFATLEKNGSEGMKIIKNRAVSPNLEKTLRTWGQSDVIDMVGRSRKSISDLENEGKLPVAERNPNNNWKVYSLENINKIRDYFKTRPIRPHGSKAAKIVVANFKGGVSKTTTTVLLAQFFAMKGYRVCLVDCDSQGSATQSFGYIPDDDIDPDNTLLPYFKGEKESLEYAIKDTYWDGLDLIPSNLALYNIELLLPANRARLGNSYSIHDILSNGIKTIEKNYDIILFDCPPSMGMISTNALFAGDSVVVPSPPSMLDFSSTVQFFGMANDVFNKLPEKNYNFLKLLITKYEKKENANNIVAVSRQLFGDYVLNAVMPMSEAIQKASTNMQTIYEIDKYEGAKKTLDRIKLSVDEVCLEVEELIIKAWSKKS